MEIDKRYVSVVNMLQIEGFPCPYTMRVEQFRLNVKRLRSKIRPRFMGIGRYGVKEYELSKEAPDDAP